MPHELVGSIGVTLTSCGKHAHDRSSVRCVTSGFKDGIGNRESGKFSKSFSKAWSKFIQWLRHKRLSIVKDFK